MPVSNDPALRVLVPIDVNDYLQLLNRLWGNAGGHGMSTSPSGIVGRTFTTIGRHLRHGRYTHRVALSNDRILSAHNREIIFSYRDRKNENRKKTMTLDAQEFIRRFLLHVLPDGFMRIRHFGFLANRSKKQSLAQCRKLLDLDPALPQSSILSANDLLLKITGLDLSRCPCCHEGTMIVVGDLLRRSSSSRWDSS